MVVLSVAAVAILNHANGVLDERGGSRRRHHVGASAESVPDWDFGEGGDYGQACRSADRSGGRPGPHLRELPRERGVPGGPGTVAGLRAHHDWTTANTIAARTTSSSMATAIHLVSS